MLILTFWFFFDFKSSIYFFTFRLSHLYNHLLLLSYLRAKFSSLLVRFLIRIGPTPSLRSPFPSFESITWILVFTYLTDSFPHSGSCTSWRDYRSSSDWHSFRRWSSRFRAGHSSARGASLRRKLFALPFLYLQGRGCPLHELCAAYWLNNWAFVS